MSAKSMFDVVVPKAAAAAAVAVRAVAPVSVAALGSLDLAAKLRASSAEEVLAIINDRAVKHTTKHSAAAQWMAQTKPTDLAGWTPDQLIHLLQRWGYIGSLQTTTELVSQVMAREADLTFEQLVQAAQALYAAKLHCPALFAAIEGRIVGGEFSLPAGVARLSSLPWHSLDYLTRVACSDDGFLPATQASLLAMLCTVAGARPAWADASLEASLSGQVSVWRAAPVPSDPTASVYSPHQLARALCRLAAYASEQKSTHECVEAVARLLRVQVGSTPAAGTAEPAPVRSAIAVHAPPAMLLAHALRLAVRSWAVLHHAGVPVGRDRELAATAANVVATVLPPLQGTLHPLDRLPAYIKFLVRLAERPIDAPEYEEMLGGLQPTEDGTPPPMVQLFGLEEKVGTSLRSARHMRLIATTLASSLATTHALVRGGGLPLSPDALSTRTLIRGLITAVSHRPQPHPVQGLTPANLPASRMLPVGHQLFSGRVSAILACARAAAGGDAASVAALRALAGAAGVPPLEPAELARVAALGAPVLEHAAGGYHLDIAFPRSGGGGGGCGVEVDGSPHFLPPPVGAVMAALDAGAAGQGEDTKSVCRSSTGAVGTVVFSTVVRSALARLHMEARGGGVGGGSGGDAAGLRQGAVHFERKPADSARIATMHLLGWSVLCVPFNDMSGPGSPMHVVDAALLAGAGDMPAGWQGAGKGAAVLPKAQQDALQRNTRPAAPAASLSPPASVRASDVAALVHGVDVLVARVVLPWLAAHAVREGARVSTLDVKPVATKVVWRTPREWAPRIANTPSEVGGATTLSPPAAPSRGKDADTPEPRAAPVDRRPTGARAESASPARARTPPPLDDGEAGSRREGHRPAARPQRSRPPPSPEQSKMQ